MTANNHIILEINKCRYYKDLCNKIARDDLADDLYQEFILALLTYDELPDIYSKEWFRQFAKRIINNLYHSRTSTFALKYRHIDKTIKYLPGIPAVWSESMGDMVHDQQDILACIKQELDKIDSKERKIFKAMVEMQSARKLALKTRVNRKNITAIVKKVKDQIRNSKQVQEFLNR